jgi:hypothetical protein
MSNDKRESKGQPVGGQFANHNRDEATVSLRTGRYVDSTPPAIDEELASYYGERRTFEVQIWSLQDEIRERQGFIDGGKQSRWGYRSPKDPEGDIARAEAKIEILAGHVLDIDSQKIDPIDEEFKARGGWTRFFLVTSSGGGHVHSTMRCSSCNYRTRFIWLTEESGKNEAEIVEKAADGACTVCFSTAPVADRNNPRPNPYEDPDVKAARAARAEVKAAKVAKELITGIRTPDGEELREENHYREDGTLHWRGSLIKTERAAEINGVDHLVHAKWSAAYRANDPDSYQRPRTIADDRDDQTYVNVVEALAAKRGQTVDEVRAHLEAKAEAKFKRENR